MNVAAVTEARAFLVFRQVKYAVDGTSLAPVGGYLDDGEEPLAAARRELLEETGYEAAGVDAARPVRRRRQPRRRRRAPVPRHVARGGSREPDADDLEEQELL